MAVRPTADEPVAPAETATVPSDTPTWLYYVSAVLAVVVVACVGTLVYLFVNHTGGGSVSTRVSQLVNGEGSAQAQSNADVVQVNDERSAAMAVADQFVLRVNTYGPHDLNAANKMPGYIARVYAVSSAKLQASFDQGVTLAEQSVSQTGVVRSVDLFATGASSIDPDSATVLVAGAFGQSYPNPQHPKATKKRIPSNPVPFRFDVKLVKIGDAWKVDDFSPVAGDDTGAPATPTQQGPAVPGGSASPRPTTQPTTRPTTRPTPTAPRRPSGTPSTGAGR